MSAVDVISWALVMTLPVNLLLSSFLFDFELTAISVPALISFSYIGLVSMYVGFFFWYKGIAIGGIARVGQVQLLQPFLALIGAYMLLDESIKATNIAFAVGVLAVVLVGKKTRAK